jgi:hypothetical protein
MNRPEIDFLISLNEDFDKLHSPTSKKSEDICGWVDSKDSPTSPTTRKVKNMTQGLHLRKLKEVHQQKHKNQSLVLSSKKDNSPVSLSPQTMKSRGRALRDKFFPDLRPCLYKTPNEKYQNYSSFDQSLERCRVVQDRSFRLTSATPVMLVRRKNLYS